MTLNKRYPSVRNNGAEANRYSIFHLTSRLPANSLFDNVHKTRIIFVISFRPPHEQMCDTKITNLSLPLRAGHRNVYPGQIGVMFPGRLTWRNSENVGCRTVGERARGTAGERSKRKRKGGGGGRKRSRGRPVRTTDTLLPWRLPRHALLLVRKTNPNECIAHGPAPRAM